MARNPPSRRHGQWAIWVREDRPTNHTGRRIPVQPKHLIRRCDSVANLPLQSYALLIGEVPLLPPLTDGRRAETSTENIANVGRKQVSAIYDIGPHTSISLQLYEGKSAKHLFVVEIEVYLARKQ